MTYPTKEDVEKGFFGIGGSRQKAGSLPEKRNGGLKTSATMALLRRRDTLCGKNAPSLNLKLGAFFR